ncbi:MAG: BMP family ABC transporter substrate-binding protein [Anaerolineales bacterium]|nr:BMP family ABC transporter substrate-binding protein [Anaerolineales bacterium]
MHKRFAIVLAVVLVVALVAGVGVKNNAPVQAQDDEFVFGLIMVGPFDDNGWSEAHFEAGLYVEENVEGARMVWVDKFNAADNPQLTMEGVVEEMVAEGAQLIIANSDDMKADVTAVAPLYPDVVFIHVSGDGVLTGDAPDNLGNFMGEMEYGKMIAGCAAALKTQTGSIGYLGPLINHETRRLASSAYLGAKYCYENYRGMDAADLSFEVVWIGFWFNIPGVTLDPTEVVNDFYNSGADVVISGIDTTQAIVVAGQRSAADEAVWAIPYDFQDACGEAPAACLGVPYFNWGPSYLETVEAVMDGTWEPSWDWNAPDWEDINNPDTSAVGFIYGDALTEDEAATLDEFIADLAAGAMDEEEGVNLFTGPLNYQDGSEFVADGEVATPEQIWYMEQLLEGMEGLSEAEG